MENLHLTWQMRSGKADLLIVGKPGIMPALTGLSPELATLAHSAEQTLRKRQVKGSNPLGGLIDIGGPQHLPVGAFAVSSTCDLWHRPAAQARPVTRYRVRENPRGSDHQLRQYRHRHG